jgi:hypothetical protein
VQIKRLLIMQSSAASHHFLPLQYPVLIFSNTHSVLPLVWERPSFTCIQKNI